VTVMQYAKNGTVFVTLEYSNAVLQISQCTNTREKLQTHWRFKKWLRWKL